MYDNENFGQNNYYFNHMDDVQPQPEVTAQQQNTIQSEVTAQQQNTIQPEQAAQQQIPHPQPTAQQQIPRQEPVRARMEHKEASKEEPKKMGFFPKLLVSVSLGLFFGLFAGIGFVGVKQAAEVLQPGGAILEAPSGAESDMASDSKETASPKVQQSVGTTVVYSDSTTHVSDIVKNVMPAMVSIINNYTEVGSFWGQTYREELSSSGSGIIVAENEEELLIVSNQHVVADADRLLVTLIDETQVEAYVKGVDADMDLAVIAIRLEDLSQETRNAITIATLGDSDELILGEQVIAIGNALGYGQSVTVGYVSALDREIDLEDGSRRSFIQTDAAINPGNSGGALLNAKGEVVGINSNKIGGSSIEGMGYAIPITAASPIIGELMERQTRSKVNESDMGYMGITYQDVTNQISMMYGMPQGVYVVSVVEGSGAEAAGMVMGDVIVNFDGNRVSDFQDLQAALQYYAVGDTAKVTVMRPVNGAYKEVELSITLGERPQTEQ